MCLLTNLHPRWLTSLVRVQVRSCHATETRGVLPPLQRANFPLARPRDSISCPVLLRSLPGASQRVFHSGESRVASLHKSRFGLRWMRQALHLAVSDVGVPGLVWALDTLAVSCVASLDCA